MSKSVLTAPHFHDEAAALAYVEGRLWPQGPTCPHCGNADTTKIGVLGGKSTRPGVRKCYACRKPFSVKVGTIFESSHVPLHLWLQAIHLICSSKKGMSSNQLHRVLGITLKSAWFLSHRIRFAMKRTGGDPLGGAGKHVEADETYIGFKKGVPVKAAFHHKRAVVSLVERGGEVSGRDVVAELIPLGRDAGKERGRADLGRLLRRFQLQLSKRHNAGAGASASTVANTQPMQQVEQARLGLVRDGRRR